MTSFPSRLAALPPSPFLKLNALLEGVTPALPVIALSVGEPQGPVPAFVSEILAREAAGFSKYPPINGTDALRGAISAWLTRRFDLKAPVDPVNGILPLNGTREGLFLALFVMVPERKNGGRPAVLLPNPYYQAYPAGALASGAEPIYVNASRETGFLPDYGALPKDVLARTAAAYVASPSNPEGVVADLGYWKRLFDLSDSYGFTVLSDECYSEIWHETPPLGAFAAAELLGRGRERLLVFNSLSKRSGLAGLRSGFVAGDPKLIAAYKELRAQAAPQVSGPIQAVSAHAWGDEAHVAANRAIYTQNFQIAAEELGNRPGFALPQAGFFLWMAVGEPVDFVRRAFAEQGLRMLPGAYLASDSGVGARPGNPGEGYVRIALVNGPETTRAALKRLASLA
ncbi:MAG: aminotransferase class I/II-fold pyridoxal phosphate-dependent enzyme [Micropepsaceae bacterium]